MIADDEKEIIQLLKVYIEAGDLKIFEANNGKTALEILAKENILKPFVSGNEARTSKSGSGLGLATSSTILAKHKGSLYIDNNVQEYTKGFVAKLPQRTSLYILLK